ncbi:MAG TPA: cytochrome c maturation protein CcmE [Bacteroidota bacterium]|nr:cytochrome c maturation protein CcmE [Bacteroidota bacterium]
MKVKILIGSVVAAAALIFCAITFVKTNVEYADFQTAIASHKTVQVKGEWLRDRESAFEASSGKFIFAMRDDHGKEMKVCYDGARPNNFEIANAIVVKGRYQEGVFQASDILTKCPSKYEGDAAAVKKTL